MCKQKFTSVCQKNHNYCGLCVCVCVHLSGESSFNLLFGFLFLCFVFFYTRRTKTVIKRAESLTRHGEETCDLCPAFTAEESCDLRPPAQRFTPDHLRVRYKSCVLWYHPAGSTGLTGTRLCCQLQSAPGKPTFEDVSLLQLLRGGSLAQPSERQKREITPQSERMH